MKNTIKFIALIITVICIVASFPVSAIDVIGEPASEYNTYGYYAYFDFENYSGYSNHLEYVKSTTAKTADGKLCNPYSYVANSGNANGDGSIIKETNGNHYYSFKRDGKGDYEVMAVFAMQTNADNNTLIGDAAELSFRLRMQAEQTMAANKQMPLVTVRRGTSSFIHCLFTDIAGNLYINNLGNITQVYSNNTKTEFMDISFKWYDVSNSFSVYLNGKPLAEGIPYATNFRTSDYVTQTFNDDFEVESRKLVATQTFHYSAIELCRSSAAGETFNFDIDDIKLCRIATKQGGAYYYENSFDGAVDGIENFKTYSTYVYKNETTSGDITRSVADSDGNRYINVKSGHYIGIKDSAYQQFTQDSVAVSFKVKAKATHTDGFKSLAAVVDNKTSASNNIFEMLYVKPDGTLYLEKDDSTLIGGYKLDGENWLDVTFVLTKNKANAGKFGTIANTYSSLNNTMSIACYINGQYVGSTQPITYFEWRTDIKKAYSNHDLTIVKDITGSTLDTTGLIKVADGVNGNTGTENHIIYKTSDGLTYYDVEYAADKTTQVKRHKMVLSYNGNADENLRIFYGECFEGAIDDLKIYAASLPDWYFENVNSNNGGNILDIDFGKLALNAGTISDMSNGKRGSAALGTVASLSFNNSNITRKTADGTTVTTDNVLLSDYATLSLNNGTLFDYYFPAPIVTNDFENEYRFETTLKNVKISKGDKAWSGNLPLFNHRLEDDNGDHLSVALMTIDSKQGLWGGEYISAGVDNRFMLCDRSGEQIVLDNDSWNNLRADIHCENGNYYVSYYYNGNIIYLADGSLAYKLSVPAITDNLEKYLGTPNHRVRYTEINGGDSVTLDVKTIKISANKIEAYSYESDTNASSINNNVTVIELNVPQYTRSNLTGYYPLASLVKNGNGTSVTQELIFAEASSGNLAVYYNGAFYSLCNKSGDILNIASDKDIAVVYDDIDGKMRIFIGKTVAYISKGDVTIPAVDIVISSDFSNFNALEDYISVFAGHSANVEIGVNTYTIDSLDTAKILGYQENGITDAIRLIAGIDTNYYEKVGFEIELFENGESRGVKRFRHNNVFRSIIADDKDLSAAVNGYEYFAVLSITNIPEKVSENSYLIARSFTETAGVVHYDSKIKISVTNDGYSFVPFDDTDIYSQKQSILLMGQSNMAGRGDVDDVLPISDSRITVLKDGKWAEMTEPIHNDKPEAGVGLAASFAKAFVETFDCELGLVPTAMGGSSLADWSIGGELYNNAVAMAKQAQETSEICAILWHQGESDKNNYRYAAELNAILDSLIAELGLDKDKLVVITGEMGEFIGESRQLHSYSLVDAGYNYTNYGIVSANGLTNMDSVHFDAQSQRVLGYRYFDMFYNITTGQNYSFEQDPSKYKSSETIVPEADTYVQKDGSADKGNDTLLQVKKDDVRTRRAFMRFDTTRLASINVSKATLNIKLDFLSSNANLSSFKVKLYSVSSEWEEGSFNWDTQPAIIEEIAEVVDATIFAGGYKWVKIDVTDYLKKHCGEIFTIAIFNEGAADGNGNLIFYSSESAGNEPKLVISGTEKDPNEPQPVKPATFNPIADTYVQSNGTTDAGDNNFLQVKKDGTSLTRRAFMKFDTSGTDEGYVSKATLRIRLDWLSSDESVLPSFDINLYSANSEWSESTFNWSSQPAVIEKIADAEAALFKGYNWVEIDVTDYVKKHYGEIFTIAIFNEGTDNANGNLKFYSRENSQYAPQLVIS